MLADDYYWLAHDDLDGKPRLHHRAVQFGCAAALLIELVNTGHIAPREGVLVVTNSSPPQDSLSHTILDQLIGEQNRRHPIRTWLAFLSPQAPEQIAQRMLRAGQVTQHARRSLLGKETVRYLPTDVNASAGPWAALSIRLLRRQPLDFHLLCLAGLTVASELESRLLDGAPTAAAEFLRTQAAAVPAPVREVLRHTHAAIGDAVLAHRT